MVDTTVFIADVMLTGANNPALIQDSAIAQLFARKIHLAEEIGTRIKVGTRLYYCILAALTGDEAQKFIRDMSVTGKATRNAITAEIVKAKLTIN